MKALLKLLRIHHWLKNGLIFLPLVFSGQFTNLSLLSKTLLGFFTFSVAASILYIINDIQDVGKDRNHPTKCNRPLASGAVSINTAYKIVALLFAVAACSCIYVCGTNIYAWLVIVIYLFINLGYSHGWKDIPILDIVILVGGFVLRVLFGSAITGIEISNWLYLTVFTSCTYAALGKRRNELRLAGLNPQGIDRPVTRNVLQFYNFNFLDKNMYVCLGLAITFYALWCVDPITVAKMGNPYLVWTVPLLIIMGMKYSLDVENDSDGDPVEVILGDKILILLAIFFAGIIFGILYW